MTYEGSECVGQLVLRKDWNGYAFIEDICVAQNARGHGVGSALIQTAKDWAHANDLDGLALETQDTNLLACHFYYKARVSDRRGKYAVLSKFSPSLL